MTSPPPPSAAGFFPVCVRVAGQRIVLIGAGKVGAARVEEFVEAGADVLVIDPHPLPPVPGLARAEKISWLQRGYQPGDLEGARLVLAATNLAEVNHQVFVDAQSAGILVNVCDDPPRCSFILPSRFRRGPLTVSVFSDGKSPVVSRRLRRELEHWVGAEWGQLAELLAAFRARLRLRALSQPERQFLLERAVYSEALLLLREGNPEGATRLLEELESEIAPPT